LVRIRGTVGLQVVVVVRMLRVEAGIKEAEAREQRGTADMT
jgi:hypothetical protein